MIREAMLSDNKNLRFALTREWDTTLKGVNFIGLNPSTADAENDDPTIRRCIRFAKDWGFGKLSMVNLYAYRATKPEEMFAALEADPEQFNPITNRAVIYEALKSNALTVVAWGAKGASSDTVDWLLDMTDEFEMKQLGRTANGSPRHPLYCRADTKLTRWLGP